MFYEILDEMFNDIKEYKDIKKGKGIRGKLITIINPSAQKLAAIVEAIHLASLLHDDVIDDANIRRGVISINAKYGEHTAVMLGDIIYSKAFFELTKFPSEIASLISNAVYLLSKGELEDVKLSKIINLDKQKYMEMIYKKTASLIEAACGASAISRDFPAENFKTYGKNIGLAFQIVDDLLDIIQDEKTLGKPSMHDFYEGKFTLPYIYLFQRAKENEKNELKKLYKKELNKNDKKFILELMQKYNVIEDTFNEAKELIKKAKEAIKDFEIKELEEIADKIVKRTF
ncbi:MAG: polyprenyl synthetase family protein [Nautiliaceae bacterium]